MGYPSMEPSRPSLPQFMVGRSEGIFPCSQSSQRWGRSPLGSLVLLVSSRAGLVPLGWMITEWV